MQKATHINVGWTTLLSLVLFTGSFSFIYLFYIFLALLPDLDHHQGALTKKLGIKLPFKHRWFTHTLIMCILVSIWLYYLASSLWLATIGFISILILAHSHILWDLFTVSWIPYFWPVIKNFRIPWISIVKTWSNGEWIFNLIVSFINLFLIYLVTVKYNILELQGLAETSKNILSSTWLLIGLWIWTFILGYHIVSSEIKYLKKNTTKMISVVWRNIIKSLANWIVIWSILYGLVIYILPYLGTIEPWFITNKSLVSFWLLWWWVMIYLYNLYNIFKGDIEFISKTLWYVINIFIFLTIIVLTFFSPTLLTYVK